MDRSRSGVFRTGAEGLAKWLGPLEAQLMEFIWAAQGPVTAREVHEGSGAEAKYITVLTVLNNLCDKGILERAKRGRVFVFHARSSREDFLASVSREVVRGLMDLSPEIAVSSFVNAVGSVSEETLAQLYQELEGRMAEPPDGDPDEG